MPIAESAPLIQPASGLSIPLQAKSAATKGITNGMKKSAWK